MRELSALWPDAPRVGPPDAFPPYRFLSALHPHPVRDPAGHSHGKAEPSWTNDEAFRRGIDLYHAGYLWESHEAWEGVWKASTDPYERAVLQALIQLAAALIKAHVGRLRGTASLAAAARGRLAFAATRLARYRDVDIVALIDAVDRCFTDPATAWERAPRLLP
ncbi:MAG: DUF309 domain-containing protein [Planctomycetota bacterium]|nr:DUF309 domain-containing protein [Planctomycetota bacterium]